jgi:hypothetical protein
MKKILFTILLGGTLTSCHLPKTSLERPRGTELEKLYNNYEYIELFGESAQCESDTIQDLYEYSEVQGYKIIQRIVYKRTNTGDFELVETINY